MGDYREDESASESELEDEEVRLDEPSKRSIYNKDGLLEKREDISWPDNVEWIHKLTVDVNKEEKVDVNDDLARELVFYTQGLEGTRKAFEKLQKLGLPFLRPSDYYAEMVKTDTHMEKVKSRLLVEKKNIEEAEERRKAREAKKISKEVQAQKTKERSKQKKEEIESVKKWRKQRQKSGFAGGENGEDISLPFEDGKGFERTQKGRRNVAPGDRSGGMGRQGGGKGGKGMDKKRNSRDHRDTKFGFGGRKGMKKQNTADATNEFKGFNKGDFSGSKKRKR
ncbi:hypothetical protein IFM89_004455 [Coptis chinensis]|uniref:Uncharacterized protein n=1 Tax=Coptis chinensis TaxID=261450 RepID=A0A835GYP4_9MAGN|nr:hypothetical protein IFM89_004455 [Coptis chinensis]